MADTRKLFGVSALAVVLVAGALMQVSALRVYGVAPNLVLVALVVCSFFTENVAFYALLVLLAAWSVRLTPTVFDSFAVAITGAALGVFWLQRRMVARGLIGVSILITLTTAGLYAIIEPSFLLTHTGIFLAELMYNLLLGFVLFEAADRLFGKGIRQ